MAYRNEGIDLRPEIVWKASADSLIFWPKRDADAQGVASSATVEISDPSGAVVVAATPATVQAVTGRLSYSQAWPEADYDLAEDYSALWTWTISSVVYSDRQYFDIVRNRLECLIDTNDLLEIWPNLDKHLVAVGETDATKFVRRAWSHLMDHLKAGGNRPSLVLDRARLINPALQLACYYTAAALTRTDGDLWDKRADNAKEMYTELIGSLGTLKYDFDESGTVEVEEDKRANKRSFSV